MKNRITRKDCLVEVAFEGQYPAGKHTAPNGRVTYTAGIAPGSKVYYRLEGNRKVIHFVDRK